MVRDNDDRTRGPEGRARVKLTEMAACPSDEFLYELAAGALDSAGLADADRHLDQCESCRALIAELALASGGDGALPRGAQIDRYIVLDVIGRGAMGTVYTAFDPELDRRIALKLLRADVDTDLLLDEAVVMAKVSQPNVVAVFDAGRAGDTAFLAMELVSGQTLREWLEEKNRSWREVRDVFVAAARGIAAAHAAGIVHRDVKPDNILVADDGTVKVSDFGVALANRPSSVLSETGLFAGTPAYMAPEVLSGGSATEKSDQFSLCASLFEALSGSRPFELKGGLEERGSPAKTISKDVAALAEAIKRGQRSAAPGPRWLARAVGRGLEHDPDVRFGSIDQLVKVLESDRRRAPARRTALVGVAIAAAAAVTFALSSRSEVQLLDPCDSGGRQANAVFTAAKKSSLATNLKASTLPHVGAQADQTVDALENWADKWVASHRTVCRASRVDRLQSSALLDARIGCLDRRLREADALLTALAGENADLSAVGNAVAELRPSDDCVAMQTASLTDPPTSSQESQLPPIEQTLADARARAALGQFEEAAQGAKRAADAATAIAYQPAVAEATLLLAQTRASADDLHGARTAGKTALSRSMAARADNVVAEALITLAAVEGEAGDLDAAADYMRLADAASERLQRPASLQAELATVTGMVLTARGDLAAAKVALERGLSLEREQGRPRLLTALGEVSRKMGDLDAALAHHRAALALNRERLGTAHPAVATNLHNVAGVLREKDELASALTLYRQSLALKRETLGDAHSEVALTRNSIALVYIETGDFELARKELEIAETILSATGHPELASVQNNLAVANSRAKPARRPPPWSGEPKTEDPPLSYGSGKPWQKGR